MSIILGMSGIILSFLLLVYAIIYLARFQIWVDDKLREVRLESLKLKAEMDVLKKQIRADTEKTTE